MATYIGSRCFTKDGEMCVLDREHCLNPTDADPDYESVFPGFRSLVRILRGQDAIDGKVIECPMMRGNGWDPDFLNRFPTTAERNACTPLERSYNQMYECVGFEGWAYHTTIDIFLSLPWDTKTSWSDGETLIDHYGHALFDRLDALKKAGGHFLFFFFW